jgi:ATP-dependent DNA helicase RecG
MYVYDQLNSHFRLDKPHEKALAKLNIKTVFDLLNYLPARYENISDIQAVSSLEKGQDAIVYGQLKNLKTRKAWKSKKPIAEGLLEDGSAKIKVMWFNQPYIAKMYQDGMYAKLVGKVAGSEGKLYLSNPEIEPLDSLPIDRHDSIFNQEANNSESLYPVYRETKGITSKWLYHTVLKCFEKGILDKIIDPIPKAILNKYNLPEYKTALVWIHSPKKLRDAEAARKRFAFEEVFYIQAQKAIERKAVSAADTYQIQTDPDHLKKFTDRFPFPLTNSQEQAINAITEDFVGNRAMSRLLEGDVGSGKTAVAASTAYAVATSRPPEGLNKKIEFGNLQVAYMAPTEILAKQHFASFIDYFRDMPISIGLITGSGCMKFPSKTDPSKPTKISKTQLTKWIKNGEIPIVVGTHSLIYKSVEFKHLAYVIIDEQHRFGTNQRKKLAKKDTRLPHLLSMTATPIPRTLALTIYGDLDITLLTEMPKGRKPVKTSVVGPGQEAEMYKNVTKELEAGRQTYVICPRIEEPDPDKQTTLTMKSVIAEAKRLQKDVFPEYRVAYLHGKMTPKEKDEIMKDFEDHKVDILCATSVVEVGVNVPNATNIIIEGSERFGLAQLHQLRGRVIRSNHQAYCYAVTSSKSDKTKERLKALVTAKNGFELAEHDLQFRGGGELYGRKQSGLSDLGMEAIKNLKLVEAARNEARYLVDKHADLKKDFPLIYKNISRLNEDLHLE